MLPRRAILSAARRVAGPRPLAPAGARRGERRRGRARHRGDRRARRLDPGAEPRRRSTSSRCCRSRSSGASRTRSRVSVASMLAFNFFFLEPVHTLTLADSRNWFALLVFVVTSVVVSRARDPVAAPRRARRRCSPRSRRSLLEHGTVAAELERISAEAARALQAERAEITLGDEARGGFELPAGGRHGRDDPRSRAGAATRAPAGACCRRWPRCSASRSTASGSSARRSRRRRSGAPTR